MPTGFKRIIDNHAKSLDSSWQPTANFRYKSYCISNLRGGIGKSTLSFNVAFMMSRERPTLIADLCAQCNMTESMLRGSSTPITIADALRPKLLGPAFGDLPEDISYNVGRHNENFKGGRGAFFIPGSGELFAFPSSLYQQLQQAVAQSNISAVKNILLVLKAILDKEAEDKKCELQIMDCSPFYAGATHLAWCAAEAIIIPVRVDEHSVDSLELTLKMLSEKDSDFNIWKSRAGEISGPRIAAIVMTMVGARSPEKGVKDRASQMYIERAYNICCHYNERFGNSIFDNDPADAFVITDDFMSAGRISGAEGIPIPSLKVGKFHTVGGKRLQVNQSQIRYKRELEYLISVI
ncbi:MAG: AAA family ATPase [Desulfovibrionaceae bacterium]|nr:AAA family ATPase [Desulfovibrionaceae bacterium]